MKFRIFLVMCVIGLAGWVLFAQPPPEKVTLSGTVVDGESGKPVSQAEVEIFPADTPPRRVPVGGNMDNWTLAGGKKTNSDANGQFRFEGVVEGDYFLFAWLPGRVSEKQRLEVTAPKSDIALALLPLGSVSAKVTLPDGSPAANRQAFVGFPVGVAAEGRRTNRAVMLDSAGQFRLEREVAGDVQISVVVRGAGFGVSEAFHLPPATARVGLNIGLRPGATIIAEARNELSGEPLAGVRITATTFWKTAGFDMKGVTDRAGACRLVGLPAQGNQVRIWGSIAEGQGGHAEPFLKPDTPEVKCNLRLRVPEDVVSVNGRVLLPDGKAPLADSEFRAYFCSRVRDLLRYNQGEASGTDCEGIFTFWFGPDSPWPQELVISVPELGYARATFPPKSPSAQMPPLILTQGDVTQAQIDDPEQGLIGVTLDKTPDGFVIQSVLHDSPAERAGLKAGDILVRVGDNKIGQETVQELLKKLTGPPDSEVTLTVKRGKDAEPVTFKVTRGKRRMTALILKPRQAQ